MGLLFLLTLFIFKLHKDPVQWPAMKQSFLLLFFVFLGIISLWNIPRLQSLYLFLSDDAYRFSIVFKGNNGSYLYMYSQYYFAQFYIYMSLKVYLVNNLSALNN